MDGKCIVSCNFVFKSYLCMHIFSDMSPATNVIGFSTKFSTQWFKGRNDIHAHINFIVFFL